MKLDLSCLHISRRISTFITLHNMHTLNQKVKYSLPSRLEAFSSYLQFKNLFFARDCFAICMMEEQTQFKNKLKINMRSHVASCLAPRPFFDRLPRRLYYCQLSTSVDRKYLNVHIYQGAVF